MTSGLVRERRGAPRALLVLVAAIGVAAFALAALPIPWRDLGGDLLQRDAARAAREIAARLRADRPDLEPIAVSGREVRAAGGRLRLAVRTEPTDAAGAAHLHVAATIPGARADGLDACVFGRGETRGAAVADAAERYASLALPALLGLDATGPRRVLPFGGEERWAVSGFRGFLGPLSWLGDLPAATSEALLEAALFAGISAPVDGGPHLAKVVLLAKGGAWTRSVEVDGVAAGVLEAPWAGVEAPRSTVSVVRFAAFRARDRRDAAGARAEAVRRIAALEGEILARGRCPLPLLPARFERMEYVPGLCRGGRLADCADECEAGSASACYHAAQEVQAEPATERLARALFLRACARGFGSACTNAAATLDDAPVPLTEDAAEACTGPTYDAVCERSGDPWGCAMLGAALLDGRGVARDAKRARTALERACSEHADDAACLAARRRLAALDVRPP